MSQPDFVIGIGSSAGGLEALNSLLTGLPRDLNAAFVIVQHLSPKHPSLLSEIIGKKTGLDVQQVHDDMDVERDHVYVIPPDANLEIHGSKLKLSKIEEGQVPNLPIDKFFRSLAKNWQQRAIAVVLSGTGSDGSRGVRDIKEQGGTILVQSQNSASFDGMPYSAIQTGLADFIDEPERLQEIIARICANIKVARDQLLEEPLSPAQVREVTNMLRDHCNMDFSGYKNATVSRRIDKRLQALGYENLDGYIDRLATDREELERLRSEILIGVTHFFREPNSLDHVVEHVFPKIFNKESDGPIRMWIAACSTGEEAYTFAMLIREYCERHRISPNVKIFATDVDKTAILKATTGEFTASVVADVPKPLVKKYFDFDGHRFIVKRSIRDMIVFAHHNVLRDPPFTRLHFISCRNLLIYLTPETQKRLASIFSFALLNEGALLVSRSESIAPELSFKEASGPVKLYTCHKSANERNLGRLEFLQPSSAHFGAIQPTTNRFKAEPDVVDGEAFDQVQGTLVKHLVKDGMIIAEDLTPVFVYGNIGRYFTLKPGRSRMDVTQLAHQDLSISLSSSLARIFSVDRDQEPQAIVRQLTLKEDDHDRRVRIELHPITSTNNQRYALLLLNEIAITNSDVADEDAKQTISLLEKEISSLKATLYSNLEETDTTREELQATNEELIASNEELQSTNEELQSLNEELHTVNAELRSKINELTDMTRDLEGLMEVTGIGSVFLDNQLKIKRFSPRAAIDLNLMNSDMGRSITHFTIEIHPDLTADLKQVLSSQEPIERRVNDGNGNTRLFRIHPFQEQGPDTIQGVIVIYLDITESTAQIEAHSSLTEFVRISGGAIYRCDKEGRIIEWSGAAKRLLGFDESEIIGRHESSLVPADRLRESEKHFKQALLGGSTLVAKTRRIGKDGREVQVSIMIDPVRVRKGGNGQIDPEIVIMAAPLVDEQTT